MHDDFDLDDVSSIHSSDFGSVCGSGGGVVPVDVDSFLHDILHDTMKLKIYSFTAPRRRCRGRRIRPVKPSSGRSERPTRADWQPSAAIDWQP